MTDTTLRPDAEDAEEDERWMARALREAALALESEEVPVGAVIVAAGTLVARAHNQVRMLRDPTAHAEMIAITQAAEALENERLVTATMYVTLEPCSMCAGALLLARVDRIVFGAADARAGACGSGLDLPSHPVSNHRPVVTGGVLADASAELLKEFFRTRRS